MLLVYESWVQVFSDILLCILSIFVRFVFIFANLKIVFWLTPSIMNQFSREFLLDLYSIGEPKYSFLWLTSLWIHLSKRNSLENYCEYKAFRCNPKRPPVRRLVVEERESERKEPRVLLLWPLRFLFKGQKSHILLRRHCCFESLLAALEISTFTWYLET